MFQIKLGVTISFRNPFIMTQVVAMSISFIAMTVFLKTKRSQYILNKKIKTKKVITTLS